MKSTHQTSTLELYPPWNSFARSRSPQPSPLSSLSFLPSVHAASYTSPPLRPLSVQQHGPFLISRTGFPRVQVAPSARRNPNRSLHKQPIRRWPWYSHVRLAELLLLLPALLYYTRAVTPELALTRLLSLISCCFATASRSTLPTANRSSHPLIPSPALPRPMSTML